MPKLELPVRNATSEYKATLLPQSVESDEIQTGCDIKELVAETVNAILKISAPLAVGVGPLKVIAKYGLDGSGSHNVRHQQSSSEEEPSKADPSYIGSFWCPLEIKDTNGETIWTNPLPNSPIYARPVSLVRAKENRENVAEYFEPTLVKLKELETTQSTTSTGVQFMVKTEVSMVDGKMVGLLMGDSGSFCHYCNSTRAEANDLVKILQRDFSIEKSYELCQEAWRQLDTGVIAYNDPARHGQCHQPICKQVVIFFLDTPPKVAEYGPFHQDVATYCVRSNPYVV